jgi:hypothetical protein
MVKQKAPQTKNFLSGKQSSSGGKAAEAFFKGAFGSSGLAVP